MLGTEALGTFRTAEVHSALGDLDPQVLAEAAQAGAVSAAQQFGQLFGRLTDQT